MSVSVRCLAKITIGLGVLSLLGIFLLPSIPQPLSYHDFSDQQAIFGVPHFWNVASNLPFLLIGIRMITVLLRNRSRADRLAWFLFSIAVIFVSLGSSYYHWNPSNGTLVWDRLPMTVGFMAAFIAIAGEIFGESARRLLWLAILLGLSSVVVWWCFDDLRFYGWIQFFPLLAILLFVTLGKDHLMYRNDICWALIFYLGAKVFENWDHDIHVLLSGYMSGHPIKHVLAALGAWYLAKGPVEK